ncbi:uncharacterized protein with transglutaminase domain [Aliiruegeria haliotis]|uniref:Uncharacterized protein with transglutaminase domain n=1 Tax=Aliiruegeria haliotis TaxID=1280846 RepID=A0A2T0RSY5_9RHOB|nr:inactive transglutaminase family protein [Aliiruegeria haliotis]PRY24252.1 uncharacterized protein with transglutaminase domain [Aliiruegeria haliotis]
MSAKSQLRIIVTVLLIVGFGMTAFKHFGLGFPLTPGMKETVWTAEARISFQAAGEPVKVSMSLPQGTDTLLVVDQGAAGRGFGFHIEKDGPGRTGVWQARAPVGNHSLYYRARIYRGNGTPPAHAPGDPEIPQAPIFTEDQADAADTILAEAHTFSADPEGMAIRLAQALGSDAPSPAATALFPDEPTSREEVAMIVRLLHAAGIPAHQLRGIALDEDGSNSGLQTMFEVWTGEQWVAINPATAEVGLPELFLPFQRGEEAIFEVEGAFGSKIQFSAIADEISSRRGALAASKASGSLLVDFSIFSLPVESQKTFATLLLIPIGALVVVVLRNLVGLQTSGTFMPILIALVFVQTELIPGLTLFLVVVSIGLFIRGYLTSLNLLLVPRIAAVLIVVISLYIFLSVVGFKLGFTTALSVTFFPMIIISWTIERMSVLAEEEGMKDVLIQGGGSLLTAVLAYLVMTNRYVSYWAFEFPELLLVVLAIILVIGQYTGYRLSELRRFEPLARDK